MLLVVLLLVCVVHVTGIHHDSDSDGLGFVDRLGTILLVAVLGIALLALTRTRSLGSSSGRPALPHILVAAAAQGPYVRTVVPLRC